MTPEEALLAATALHAGFQAAVTLVVYPALRDLPADGWAAGNCWPPCSPCSPPPPR